MLCNELLKGAKGFSFCNVLIYIKCNNSFWWFFKFSVINHCLDAACAVPSRAVAYKMHTVCFSHELVLHLNVCNEKPVISCEVQYSLPDETQGLSLQPQLHVIYYVKIFFEWSVCPVQLPLH